MTITKECRENDLDDASQDYAMLYPKADTSNPILRTLLEVDCSNVTVMGLDLD